MKKENPFKQGQRVYNPTETIIKSTRIHNTQTLTITTTPGQRTHTATVAATPTTAAPPPTAMHTNITLKPTTTNTKVKTHLRITTVVEALRITLVVEAHMTITGAPTAKPTDRTGRQTATHSQTLTINNPARTRTTMDIAMINPIARAPTGRNTFQTTKTVSNSSKTNRPKTRTTPGAMVRIKTTGTQIRTPTMTTSFGTPIRTTATPISGRTQTRIVATTIRILIRTHMVTTVKITVKMPGLTLLKVPTKTALTTTVGTIIRIPTKIQTKIQTQIRIITTPMLIACIDKKTFIMDHQVITIPSKFQFHRTLAVKMAPRMICGIILSGMKTHTTLDTQLRMGIPTGKTLLRRQQGHPARSTHIIR
jgi:hypothetical protein